MEVVVGPAEKCRVDFTIKNEKHGYGETSYKDVPCKAAAKFFGRMPEFLEADAQGRLYARQKIHYDARCGEMKQAVRYEYPRDAAGMLYLFQATHCQNQSK